jgi:hypothetical protein
MPSLAAKSKTESGPTQAELAAYFGGQIDALKNMPKVSASKHGLGVLQSEIARRLAAAERLHEMFSAADE